MQEDNKKTERVSAYVDGFNLYFGMMEAGLDYCKWLDIEKLLKSLLKPHQVLVEIKYFTSRVTNNPDKQKRQSTYIDAIESTNVKVIYGKYQSGTEICSRCGNKWIKSKEKMTDVNIATSIIVDAYNDKYDMGILISGDSDLTPPIIEIHRSFSNKRIMIAFPPKRHNSSMANEARGSEIIGRKKLVSSQFDSEVISKVGFKLKKPSEWS